MEKLSFLKYLKFTEKSLQSHKNFIEQLGGDDASLKDMQAELLSIKIKLDTLNKAKQTRLLNPYKELQPIIDTINKKIEDIDHQIKTFHSSDEIEKNRLINEIKDIRIILENIDSSASNYTSVQVDNKVEFLKEKIDTDKIDTLFKKYINDTKGLVNELIQIGGIDANGNTLVNNEEIAEKVTQINQKINEYKSAIAEIEVKMAPISSYINEMESLYDISSNKIDVFKPIKLEDPKTKDKIKIEPANDENTKFTYFDLSGYTFTEKELVDPESMKAAEKYSRVSPDATIPRPAAPQPQARPAAVPGVPQPQARPAAVPGVPQPQARPGVPGVPQPQARPAAVPGVAQARPGVPQPQPRPVSGAPKPVIRELHLKEKYMIEQTKIPIYNNDDMNNKMITLYGKWKNYLTNKVQEKENLLDSIKMKEYLEFIKNKFTIFKDVTKIKSTDEITKILSDLTRLESTIANYIASCSKENKDCVITNLDDIKKMNTRINNVLSSISTELNITIENYNKLPQTTEDEKNYKTNLRFNKIKPVKEFLDKITSNPNNIQIGGTRAQMGDFISTIGDFEKEIRTMIQKRFEIIKSIKKYNVRYSQFIAFQKYIVNYVSLTIAQGEYHYYQYISKGRISFYDSILQKMNQIIDKFENPKDFNDKDLVEKENKVLYGRHYFMIKILANFFRSLYELWDTKKWSIYDKINVEEKNSNKKYYFLFNIFFKFLDTFHMNLPPIANYLRINDFGSNKNISFEKKDKHTLDREIMEKQCTNLNTDPLKTDKLNAAKNINFAEVFDPTNFKENESLSYYMGLSETLSDKKSIMLLTYGYSGVGKTFTLFGSVKTDSAGKKTSLDGLLQTTLNNVTDYANIKMKAFELYGLGVAYKFYWEKDPKKFDHVIYHYNNINGSTADEPIMLKTDKFDSVLVNEESYVEIDADQINKFSEITDSIDKIRHRVGRIRPTINNPESSRSIMIYDFKITFKDNKSCKLVIMDLPGKENLYQTYCTSKTDAYMPQDKYCKGYNTNMIKSMMYINPLWMSTIPEIAEHLDILPEDNKDKWNPEKLHSFRDVNYREVFKGKGFDIIEQNSAHKQTQMFRGRDEFNNFTYGKPNANDRTKLALYGILNRSFNNTIDYMQNINGKNLFGLGKKINEMLKDEKLKEQNYGYAGLEGIYINENILGLLEVLGEKIQIQKRSASIKHVVCPQKEIYKSLFGKSKNPISNDIKHLTPNIKFAEESEFYSQIMFMNNFLKPDINQKFYENITESNKKSTIMNSLETYKTDTGESKGIIKDINDHTKNWINNYDYNSIFNIKNPPIKSILSTYLDDPSFSNFYLFFVVSNNFKKDGNIDTCDKQLQLLYDTRVFMDIIANDDAKGITCNV